jgi:(R,R)-butanediol dehydrogenase/meso-butanediol dehydrogenase/diacetyl reductase
MLSPVGTSTPGLMRGVRIHGKRHAEVEDLPVPMLVGPGRVKVSIEAAGICGTDLWLYEWAPIPDDRPHACFGETGPHVLGHEMAGRVDELSEDVTDLQVGDLVAVRPLLADGTCASCLRGESNICENRGFIGIHGGGGGFSEFVVVDREQIHPLPASVTAEIGALVETLATCWHAVASVDPRPGDVALVTGAGPIGLGLVLSLKARGVDRVLVSEPSEVRRELANRLGAESLDPRVVDIARHAQEATAGGGVDHAFDAAGAGDESVAAELAALRRGGTLVVVAEHAVAPRVDLAQLMQTGKGIVGSSAYTAEDFDAVIAAIGSGGLDPAPLVTSRISIEQVVTHGLEYLLDGGRDGQAKVMVIAGDSTTSTHLRGENS